MRPQRRIYVHTTDLRLNLGKDLRKRPSPLTALTETEWEAIQKIILITRQVLTMRDGRLILTNLPEEFTWILLLMRWTGMRREEVLTLRTTHFFKPNYQQLLNGYVEIDIGPSTGTNTKFGKDRTIEMPSQLMSSIYNYLQSSRYITRRRKYRKIYNEHHFENDFAFISESGENYSLSTLNSRWSDIRRTIEDPKLGLGESFEHKPHNLRATYAVERIINLLDHNISEGKAFRHIQGHLGHENEDTTLHYLTQAQDRRKGRRSPQAVWENIVDYHLQQGLFSKKDSQ
ncbi:site-specific integrase [Aeromonas hydrophila]|uniref:site-specific integrase n=3 Tax=Aeromonadaceae TaxID=84642 RepID=UPI000E5708CD|nr:site-specific integrase [Aeromonas hydrophila]